MAGELSENHERRIASRHPVSGRGRLLPESDAMRVGVPFSLIDLSATGIRCVCEYSAEINEPVQLELGNTVQRVQKTVRGRVKHCTTLDDVQYVIGIEFSLRLTPNEVLMIRHGSRSGIQGDGPQWI